MINPKISTLFTLLLLSTFLHAQTVKKLSLQEAIDLGISNSKNLKLSQHKIEEALARLAVVKDEVLPSATASFLYNHAEIPTHTLSIGGGNPLQLPNRADAFVGTAALQEVIYAGGKYKYAQQSTEILSNVARLDAAQSKEEITYGIINTYFSLFKIVQSQKVVAQNLEAIASQLKQAQRFYEQGIVTKNDVLRFQLQEANVSLTGLEIENNRKIINYNLDILLGLPEDTEVALLESELPINEVQPLAYYIDAAFGNRQELQVLALQDKVANLTVKSTQANTRPTIGLGANLYYINPSGSFIPKTTQFIVPITLGATVSWNVASLWNNKNKVAEAKIKQQEIGLQKDVLTDQLKRELNTNYQNYSFAVKKIDVLAASIAQATENDRLLASKYKNNIASATDRIDAETLLYQAKINLELAKADAKIAYYTLLKSTGKIAQ